MVKKEDEAPALKGEESEREMKPQPLRGKRDKVEAPALNGEERKAPALKGEERQIFIIE